MVYLQAWWHAMGKVLSFCCEEFQRERQLLDQGQGQRRAKTQHLTLCPPLQVLFTLPPVLPVLDSLFGDSQRRHTCELLHAHKHVKLSASLGSVVFSLHIIVLSSWYYHVALADFKLFKWTSLPPVSPLVNEPGIWGLLSSVCDFL